MENRIISTDGDKYGYYVIHYSCTQKRNRSVTLALAQKIPIVNLFVLFGIPTDSSRMTLQARLKIFDSSGNLVKEYTKVDSYTHRAGLYYGYKPTKRVSKRSSKMFAELIGEISQDTAFIDSLLTKSGPITSGSEEEAKNNINFNLLKNLGK